MRWAVGSLNNKALSAAKVLLRDNWEVRGLIAKVNDVLIEDRRVSYDVLTVLLGIRNNQLIIQQPQLLCYRRLIELGVRLRAKDSGSILVGSGRRPVGHVSRVAGGLVLGAHARVVAVITTIGDAILRQTTTFRGQAVALPQQVLQSLVVLVLQFRKLAAIGHRRGHSDGDGSVVRTECRGVGGSVNRGHDRHAHGVGISLRWWCAER